MEGSGRIRVAGSSLARRRDAMNLRWRIRSRRTIDSDVARELWQEFAESHGNDQAAAMGELLATVMTARLMDEESKW